MKFCVGEIVGVVLLNDGSSDETILNVSFGSPSSRRLEETKGKLDPIIIAQVFLVRRTLAWITGIILIIATLLGVSFLYIFLLLLII